MLSGIKDGINTIIIHYSVMYTSSHPLYTSRGSKCAQLPDMYVPNIDAEKGRRSRWE